MKSRNDTSIPVFSRGTWESGEIISRLGRGEIGGKATGLMRLSRDLLAGVDQAVHPEFEVAVPRMVILGTDIFDSFIAMNNLGPLLETPVSDARVAQAFGRAALPPEILGDLRDFISQVEVPLAVRSSSRMEDALAHPFAGVYATKMLPNNQPDVDTRFNRLVEAIRFVYATTYMKAARGYFQGLKEDHAEEKMALVIQEVAGNRYGTRFYPQISGVARSFNYYPNGSARTTDGVVNLALGLGRQIVNGDRSWSFCPACPASPPPFNDVGDRLRNTQTAFWAVNMGPPPPPDPMGETEFLLNPDLSVGEQDEILDHLVSTYDPGADRLRLGLAAKGPRVLDFGPILVGETLPLSDLMKKLLPLAERTAGCPVELEFAIDRRPDGVYRLCLLQMRSMAIPEGESRVSPVELIEPGVVVASERATGHGIKTDIADIVYLKPETFETSQTPAIALEINRLNGGLLVSGRPYMLVGFGRWGSADPWLGVPVDWSQINGARVIVECAFRDLNPDPSQGAHFFHNLIAVGAFYLTVRGRGSSRVEWDWLQRQPVEQETKFVRHVRLPKPLQIRVDGLAGLAVCKVGGDA